MKKIRGYITVEKLFEIDNPILEEVIDDLSLEKECEFNMLLNNYSDEIGDTKFEKFVTEQYKLKVKLERELLSKEISEQMNLKNDEKIFDFRIEDIDGRFLLEK